MSLLQYTALQETDEIRLLELQPGPAWNDIRCRLLHVKLSSGPQFEALSYMRGAKKDPMVLETDNHKTLVRNNLWQALRHLRTQDETRIIWVDTLYINQNNNRERGNQVAQMSKIYAQAQSVRVWLGLDHHEGKITITAASNYLKEAQLGFWSQPHYLAYKTLY